MTTMPTCSGTMLRNGFYQAVVCGKTASVEREGKWYCKTHDQVAVEEKRAKRNAKWEAEHAVDMERSRLAVVRAQKRQAIEAAKEAVVMAAKVWFEHDTLTDLLEAMLKLQDLETSEKGEA